MFLPSFPSPLRPLHYYVVLPPALSLSLSLPPSVASDLVQSKEGRGGGERDSVVEDETSWSCRVNVTVEVTYKNGLPLPATFNAYCLHRGSVVEDETSWSCRVNVTVKVTYKNGLPLQASFNAYCLLSCREHGTISFCLCRPTVILRQGQGHRNEHERAYMASICLWSCHV